MSKPVKNLIIDMYRKEFADVTGAVLIDIRGVDSEQTQKLRTGLRKKSIKITVVKNTLARKSFEKTVLEPIGSLLEGPSAVVYGADSVVSVARELLDVVKKIETVQLKGAVMDGEVYGAKDIEKLSKFPTKAEAQAQVIQVFLSAAGNVISAATSAGNNIAGVIEALEKKLEKGEAVTKVA
jgi:large subunit ribosomal protein L10